MQTEGVKVGTICHGLWLMCADPQMLKGRRVTCAHNIICDVENAGADIVFDGDKTADVVVDRDLITAKHPGVLGKFLETFVREIEAGKKGK
jgi:putative intracellular protease/amidase